MNYESINTLNIRSQFGPYLNFSGFDTSQGTDAITDSVKNGYQIRKELNKFSDRIPEELKDARFISILFCVNLVSTTFDDLAKINLRAGRYEGFVSYFDLSWGASAVTGLLMYADERLRGKNVMMAESVELVENSHVALEPDHAHSVYSEVSDMSQNATRILEEDATGLLLVDEALKYVYGVPNRITDQPVITYHNPELVVKGAELSASIYQSVFPIARELFGLPSEE